MANFLFFTIIAIIFLSSRHSKASSCIFFLSLLEFYFPLDYVNQIGSENGIGSQSSPYPNISTAIRQNQDKFFELTLILVASFSPYNFSESDSWPNLNLTLMYFNNLLISLNWEKKTLFLFRTQNSNISQTVLFQNSTLMLNSNNSRLTLINIEMKFNELNIFTSFIIVENRFSLVIQVTKTKN